MRTRTTLLLLGPLFLLLVGCTDQLVNPPPETLLSMSEDEAAVYETVDADGLSYEAIELGTLTTSSHNQGRASAINQNPVGGSFVVGTSTEFPHEKAVLWEVSDDGSVSGPVKLGELPEPMEDYVYQLARDVNSDGVIVGEAYYQDPESLSIFWNRIVGWIYEGNGMNPLPWFGDDTYSSFAWDINEGGLVTGWIRIVVARSEEGGITEIETRGALWLPPYQDEPILLDPLAGHERAHARTIDDDGTIAGWSWTGSDSVGVYWTADAGGSISGPYALAAGFRPTAMNGTGHVAGHQSANAVLWDSDSGTLHGLGALRNNWVGHGTGISDAEDGAFRIVGWSGRTTEFKDRLPTTWTWTTATSTASGPVELALPSNYSGGFATDVDERGWTVGVGFEKHRSSTTWRAILWRPVQGESGDDDEPEPCTHPRGKCK